MALPHQQAFDEVNEAWDIAASNGYVPQLTGADRVRAIRYAMAIGYLESSYGYGWEEGKGKDSNNMGAITAGASWTGATFSHADSTPTTSYVAKFRVYPTRIHGWVDLIRIAFKPKALAAAVAGDTRGVSQAMYDARYYTGTSTTPSVNVDRHAAAVKRGLDAASTVLGPVPPGSIGTPSPPSSLIAPGVGLLMAGGLAIYAWSRVRGIRFRK